MLQSFTGLNKCVVSCIPHCSMIHRFHCQYAPLINLPSSQHMATTDLFFFLPLIWFSHLENVMLYRIMLYATFSDWLLSFITIHLRFIHVCGLIACSILLLNNIPWCRCTTVCLAIHLLKDILSASSWG